MKVNEIILITSNDSECIVYGYVYSTGELKQYLVECGYFSDEELEKLNINDIKKLIIEANEDLKITVVKKLVCK